MIRKKLITLTLCVLLLLTAGAVVAAKTSQAGNSPIYQFGVTLHSEVVGKIIVNTKQQTFVFNGKGLTPGSQYFLVGPGSRSLGSANADDDGSVHIAGDSVLWNDDLADSPQFFLHDSPRVGIFYIIYPKLSTCYVYKPFWSYWNVQGYLTDQKTGRPLINQEVLIYQFTSSGYVLRSTEITDDQGYFYYSRYASTLGGSTPISVIFEGTDPNESYYRDGIYWAVAETYSHPAVCP